MSFLSEHFGETDLLRQALLANSYSPGISDAWFAKPQTADTLSISCQSHTAPCKDNWCTTIKELRCRGPEGKPWVTTAALPNSFNTSPFPSPFLLQHHHSSLHFWSRVSIAHDPGVTQPPPALTLPPGILLLLCKCSFIYLIIWGARLVWQSACLLAWVCRRTQDKIDYHSSYIELLCTLPRGRIWLLVKSSLSSPDYTRKLSFVCIYYDIRAEMFMTLCKQFHILQGRGKNLHHSIHIRFFKHLKYESLISTFLYKDLKIKKITCW